MFHIARKRKKTDPFEELIKLSSILIGFTVFVITREVVVAIIAAFVTILVILLFKFIQVRSYNVKLRKSNITEIDSFDGVQFENYLKELFKSKGYKAELTATTGDFGADLILNKENRRYVVQAKRYSKPVGIKAVQEVISAIKMYKATDAWVVTNNSYTKAAIQLAKTHDVLLIGREQLIDLITQTNKDGNNIPIPSPIEIKREIKQETKKICTECGSKMVIRPGPKGIFYGCTRFPHCRYTIEAI